jgi:hypothetical protein
MGVRHFLLVDHDVLLPENLVRNALDWQGVTQHKVDAVTTAIRNIAADADVAPHRVHLTGQESNAVVGGIAARLGGCDLIIDATANSKTLNLLSAIAHAAQRPLVWLEVFGGGVGGLIARSRPGVDPVALQMRAAYLQYCEDNPAPAGLVAAKNYSDTVDEKTLTASDADVAIVAHHAARLALDSLLASADSQYPYSMYLIGLSTAWVFTAPFDTIPISVGPLDAGHPDRPSAADPSPDDIEFLRGLLAKRKDATGPTS